jgi:membrane fusion protein (multidrug efflux system)
VRREFDAPARVMAKYRVEVLARINGYLTKSYFKEGDFVKKGQLLFEIEPEQYSNAAGQAKGNLENARAQQEYYNKQLARYKELVENDFVAHADYDNVLAQRDSYRAQVQSMENAYRDAQRNLSYTHIKSPVDGRVGIIDVTVGNYVSPNSGPLTTINSSDPMYVTFPLESKDYAELNRIDGSPNVKRDVEFTFSSGQKYEHKGIQDFYDNRVDESTGTITLRATFPNPDSVLLQGDFGRIKIYSNSKDEMPIVPQTATMENQEGLYVYIMDEENNPKLTYIKTMGQVDTNWVVYEGVKKGDRIITTGMQKVIPGSPVRVVETATEAENAQIKKPNIFVRIINKIKRILGGK